MSNSGPTIYDKRALTTKAYRLSVLFSFGPRPCEDRSHLNKFSSVIKLKLSDLPKLNWQNISHPRPLLRFSVTIRLLLINKSKINYYFVEKPRFS